jgi:hypothetical protein
MSTSQPETENKVSEILNTIYVPKDYGMEMSEDFKSLLKQINEANEPAGLHAIEVIIDYVKSMQPNVMREPEDGVFIQIQLLNAVNSILKLTDNFNLVYGTLLRAFHDYGHTVFNGVNLYRYSDRLEQTQYRNFTTIMHLLRVTANPVTRKQSKKHIDYNRALVCYPEVIRNKVLGFYGAL